MKSLAMRNVKFVFLAFERWHLLSDQLPLFYFLLFFVVEGESQLSFGHASRSHSLDENKYFFLVITRN